MSKPWAKRSTRRPQLRQLHRHLIVCEDAKSAVDYLKSFEVSEDHVEMVVEGGAGNTDGVVERALELRGHAEEQGTPYSKVWCVFDRDSFPAKNFNRAFQIATPYRDVEIIWANECFELWYLLHFAYRDTAISRDDIYHELSKASRLGKKYDKADQTVFVMLRDKLPTALRNARTLYDSYGAALRPERDNPSTKVHILVDQLLQLGALQV